ncbi:MAG: PAS domain S-box protein [Bacteriovoracaceae bacterium]
MNVYDTFFKFSPELMFVGTFDGYFREVNTSMQTILGWSEHEFKTIPILDFVHPDDQLATRTHIEMASKGQVISDFHCRIKTKKGKWIWTKWSAVLSEDQNSFCGIGRDCTKEKEGSYLTEQMFEVLEKTAIIAITDLKGKITFVNEKFCEVSGYAEAELIGKDHRILNSGLHDKNFFKNMWATIYKGKVWQGEVRNVRKDKSYYWVHTTIAPIRNSFGKIEKFISVRFDISKEKEAQVI